MKIKIAFLALMLMLTAAGTFVAQSAHAVNDGDYTETSNPQWWWKFVRTSDWSKTIQITSVDVGKEVVNAKTQEVTNVVVVTFTNRSAKTVECDGSVSIAHVILNKGLEAISDEELLPARMPKALRPGESFQVQETATTPSKLRGYMQTLEVTER